MTTTKTSYLRLNPLHFSSLPPHDSLIDQTQEQSSSSRPNLESFLSSILKEAQTLVSDTIPQKFKVNRKLRSSAPSTAKVQLSTYSDSASASGNISSKHEDYWVCRKSIHAARAQKGSASWSEFEKGLRENHSENEMDYTPSVASVEYLVQWPVVEELEGWRGIDMHVNMITHTFNSGGIVSPRTFISLVISADEPTSSNSKQGFYTIQIPVLFNKDSPNDVPETLRQKITSTVPKNTVFAHYASVERVRLQSAAAGSESESESDDDQVVEWIMATASDAGGRIPQWVQRSWTMGGVPKAVVADVGLFLGWVDKKRS